MKCAGGKASCGAVTSPDCCARSRTTIRRRRAVPEPHRRTGGIVSAVCICLGFVAPSRVGAATPRTAAPTLYVAANGSDHNPGTSSKPLRSVASAIAHAPAGATVVIASGVYREALGAVTRPITLEAASGAHVWLSGADAVTGWAPTSGGWVHHGW